MNNLISRIESLPMSGSDAIEMAKAFKIDNISKWMLYDDMVKFKNINEMFGEKRIIYILLQIKNESGTSDVGHWVALIWHKQATRYYYFDPYGLTINKDLSLTHEPDTILKLLKGLDVDVNNIRHQMFKSDVNTCLRHCVIRSIFWHLNNKEYDKFIVRPSIQLGVRNSDILVSLLSGLLSNTDDVLIQFFNKKETEAKDV